MPDIFSPATLAAPTEPPVNLPGGNPQPPKPKLFCTDDHRAWLPPFESVEGETHWAWDGQPYDKTIGPFLVSAEDPSVHVPLTDLADHPGFHSAFASHAAEDYFRAAVTS
jgi:hypothetical protein